MAAMESFCYWMRIDLSKLSKEEIILLEAAIFSFICIELKNYFKEQHKHFFRLINMNIEKENIMLDHMFLKLVIKDILSTKEYNMTGLAYYANTHEDVIQDVLDGLNTDPSANLLRKCIDLHRLVRRDLYGSIIKKLSCDSVSAS